MKLASPRLLMGFLPALFLLFIHLPLLGQTRSQLAELNRARQDRTRNSMAVLSSWAAANVVVGAIGMGTSTGEARAFHQMNLAWGAINLAFAAPGFLTARRADPASFDLYQSTQQHHRIQKLFLFNAGLDAGYVMSGFWLQERAKTVTKNPERLRGFGKSVVLQGAFLFAFDLGAFFYHRQLQSKLKPLLQGATLGLTEDGVSIRLPVVQRPPFR